MNPKQEIERDFSKKRDSYYKNNYLVKSKANYLRRLRNALVCAEIDRTTGLKNVIDVGCGPAILYRDLLEKCSNYYALDLVQSNLNQIANTEKSGKIRLINRDLDNFQLEENFFDLVICSGSVEYTSNPAFVLSSLIRATKPGGKIICSFPNVYSPFRIWSNYIYRHVWVLKNKLLKLDYSYYPRKLFNERSVIRVFEEIEPASALSIRYFGLKLIPQPFDILLSSLDYKILRKFEEKQYRFARSLCEEFLVSYQKPSKYSDRSVTDVEAQATL